MRILPYFLLLLMLSCFSAVASTVIAAETPTVSASKINRKALKQQLKKTLELYKQKQPKAERAPKKGGNGQVLLVGIIAIALLSAIVFGLSCLLEGPISYWQALLWASIGVGVVFSIIVLMVSISFKKPILSGWGR